MTGSVTRARSEDGAAAVEFALVWFVLALLLIGIVQFGFIFNQWLQMEHAAREGARWAALRNPASTVRAEVKEAAPGLALTDGDIVIDPADPTSVSVVPNTPMRVTVNHAIPVFTPVIAAFGGEVQMSATSVQKVE